MTTCQRPAEVMEAAGILVHCGRQTGGWGGHDCESVCSKFAQGKRLVERRPSPLVSEQIRFLRQYQDLAGGLVVG